MGTISTGSLEETVNRNTSSLNIRYYSFHIENYLICQALLEIFLLHKFKLFIFQYIVSLVKRIQQFYNQKYSQENQAILERHANPLLV